jgi:DNA-binding MarR family transcriptional regulator
MSDTPSRESSRLHDENVVLWLRLARVYQKIDRLSTEHLHVWGLSVALFDVIAQIGGVEGQTQQELADRLLVTKGNVSQLLAKLESRGIIRRTEDGRALRVYLTSEGRSLFDAVVPAHERFISECFRALEPQEAHIVRHALRRVDHCLE